MQVIGVYKSERVEIIAEALKELGSESAYVVHGLDGLDEISIKGQTKISELKDGRVLPSRRISPADFGIKEGWLEDITGGPPAYNAKIALDILNGKAGAPRDMVLMNAAAALKIAGKSADFKEGVKLAGDAIDSGNALQKLNMLKDLSRDDSQ